MGSGLTEHDVRIITKMQRENAVKILIFFMIICWKINL
jgi:hypothetical protein